MKDMKEYKKKSEKKMSKMGNKGYGYKDVIKDDTVTVKSKKMGKKGY